MLRGGRRLCNGPFDALQKRVFLVPRGLPYRRGAEVGGSGRKGMLVYLCGRD